VFIQIPFKAVLSSVYCWRNFVGQFDKVGEIGWLVWRNFKAGPKAEHVLANTASDQCWLVDVGETRDFTNAVVGQQCSPNVSQWRSNGAQNSPTRLGGSVLPS